MGAAVVRRPTEQLALGRVTVTARALPSIREAFEGLVAAERAGDLYGAMLCRCLVQRIARDGKVGE
ncbi:hypothetical protein [Streptomyces lavendulae]|uniref:hypothetical protein n=1 Tax=Streptomyces lavendulae TaxID=1914 RepID=UPI0024A3041B|nr:hypothetical protein Sros01_15030 [Streptomyces roseochromogenus]